MIKKTVKLELTLEDLAVVKNALDTIEGQIENGDFGESAAARKENAEWANDIRAILHQISLLTE